jgi:RNA polymerase sigma factor, sigma-70 family
MLDKDTFTEIYDKYFPIIYNFCNIKTNYNKQAAMDITQDVFLLAWEKRNKLYNEKIASWLFETAKNKIFDYFKKIKKDSKINIAISESIETNQYSDTYSFEQTTSLDYLNEIIKTFTDDEITLIHLRFIKATPYKQIAIILNIKEETIRVRCSRLREKLKDKFTNYTGGEV